jgi:two-component system OmpR family response regulator
MAREQALRAYQHQRAFLPDYGLQAEKARPVDASLCRARILIVNDDPDMRRMLSDYLRQHNMSVTTASGKQDMALLLSAERFSIIILDRQIGQEDGLDLLRDLRARTSLPIILLTGGQNDLIDRVVGLELGADDSITKPFSMRELLARVGAVLRRTEAPAEDSREPTRDKTQQRLRFGKWTLDKRMRQLADAEDDPVALTKSEYTLLLAFLDAPGRPLSREHLLQATRVHEDVFDRSIDVQILRLRRKLDTDPGVPSVIRTERGVGYVFTLPVDAA